MSRDLATALAQHALWVRGRYGGTQLTTTVLRPHLPEARAVGLVNADLRRSYLPGIDLRDVDLTGVVASEANLRDADLQNTSIAKADFYSTNLTRARMTGCVARKASLIEANLFRANLTRINAEGANLRHANLAGASLADSNMLGVDISGANLCLANLVGSNMLGTILPSPVAVLLAAWGNLSAKLCSEAMAFDAANHLGGVEAFTEWANGGDCPYIGEDYGRACNFYEHRVHWNPAVTPPTAIRLMANVIREKCSNSDFHETSAP